MATMVLPISLFRCNLQRQIFYPASATAPPPTAAKTASTTAAPPRPPSSSTTTTTRRKKDSGFIEPDYRSLVADFLVDSLGFSKREALTTSTKLTKGRQSRGVTEVCATDFHRNAELVIRFLEQKGFEKPQIRKMVSAVPGILISKAEAKLEPTINYFLEQGFSTSDIADVFSAQCTILGDIPRHFVQNVSLLLALGVPIESIRKRIIRPCVPVKQQPETLKDIVARAEAKWGVSPRSNMFFYAVDVLHLVNEEELDSICRVFESFGWDRSDMVALFRRSPACFRLSEGNIKAKLRFYMNELGYDVGLLLKRPWLLYYSLERRVWPRHLLLQILKYRALVDESLPLFKALGMTESKFLKQYIQTFEDAVPNLRYIYVNFITSFAQQETKSSIKSEIED